MTQYQELKGNAYVAYKKLIGILRKKAMDELHLSENEIVVRPLRPADLQSTTVDWYFVNTNNSGSAWANSDSIDGATIANNRFIGINGFFNQTGASSLHALRITREGAVAREWVTASVPKWKHKACWVDDPITLDRNTTVTLTFYQGIASTLTDTFGLLGAVAEKRGLLIAP